MRDHRPVDVALGLLDASLRTRLLNGPEHTLCDTLAESNPQGDAVSTENRGIVRRFIDEFVNQKNDATLDVLDAADFTCHVWWRFLDCL
jgi:hypothetical protein